MNSPAEDTPGSASDTPQRRRIELLDLAPALTLVLVAAMAARPIGDASFLWHIRSGSAQHAINSVITIDPFSFTRLGEDWRTQSWLVELLYSTLESSFDSYAWVNWMVFFIGIVTVMFVALSLYRAVPSPMSVAIALVPLLWLMAPWLRPRPVVFSYLLLAALVVVLQNRERVIWIVVPIIWMWAAMHGSWVIGGGLIVLELIRTRDRRILFAGVAAMLSTLATAHGIGAWLVLVKFQEAGEALELLIEWQTPNFTSLLQAPFVLVIVGIIVAAMKGRIRPRDLVVIVPFLLFGLSANRSVVVATIVLAPWAMLALPVIRVPSSKRSSVVLVVAGVAIAAIVLLPMVTVPLGTFDDEKFPSAEMQEAMAGRSLFHSDVMGGYLMFSEWPTRLVYIDDRAELYGVDFFEGYLEALSGSYEELFDQYAFDAAVTEDEWLLTQRLEDDGWRRIVEDDGLVLFYAP
jgi:hypothetical protein